MGTEHNEPEPWGDLADRRDTTLAARAVRERWPMPDHVRVKVLKRLVSIVDPDYEHDGLTRPDHREATTAAKALISADRLNLDAEKFEHLKAKEKPDDEAEAPLARAFEKALERAYGDEPAPTEPAPEATPAP